MKLTLALLALVTSVIAGPVPQSSYDDYGSYDNVPAAPVDNPPPPAGGYGSYGDYDDVPVENPPPPAGGYGTYGDYGSYKRGEVKESA